MNNTSFLRNKSIDSKSLPQAFYFSLSLWTAIVITINPSGAVVNAVILTATLTYSPLRRCASFILVAHCILIDFLNTIFTNPGAALVSYFGSVRFHPYFCPIWGPVALGAISVNNWAHSVLAVNRLIAVVFPRHYKNIVTKPMLVLAVVTPWFITVGFGVILMVGMDIRCVQSKSWFTGCELVPARAIQPTIAVYIPCVIIGVSYSALFIKARLAVIVRRRVGDSMQRVSTNLENRYETAKILFIKDCVLLVSPTVYCPHCLFFHLYENRPVSWSLQ
jgi:hypothetical protein